MGQQRPVLITPNQTSEQNDKPGVLDGVENKLIMTFAEDGNVTFAIGKSLGPINLINASFILNRIANRMIDQGEIAQQQEIQRTAQAMQAVRRNAKGGDPWREGGDPR